MQVYKLIHTNSIRCFSTELEVKKKAAPSGFWNDKKNHRIFLEELGKKLGFANVEDWYKVKKTDITQNGGSKLFRLYGESIFKTVSSVFSEKSWKSWLFENEKVPSGLIHFLSSCKGFWLEKSNQREFLIYLADKLGVRSYNDWFSVKNETVLNHRGHGII